jgi:hypothetical protein
MEHGRPWVVDAWRIAEPWFLTAFKTPEGPQSPLYVDVATTDRDYLEASDKRFRDDRGAPMLCRTRAEMIAAGLRHRGALRAWDEGDNSLLQGDEAWWADQVLAGVGRAEAKAKIRWAED